VTAGNGREERLNVDTRRRADDISVIAHRGFAGIYPENTLAAITGSMSDGKADVIELDVMPTSDGSVIVFHDTDLERLTNAAGSIRRRNVWELPYESISGYDILGSGERVPLLSTALEAIPSNVAVNIELKNPGTAETRFAEPLLEAAIETASDRWIEFVGRVLDVATESGHDLLVSSFYEGALAATRRLDPTVPIASVFWDSVENGLEITRRYDTEAMHLPWNMISGTSLFNEPAPAPAPFEEVDLVGRAHEEGRVVNAWTVRTWHEASQLRRAGVDGVITDYPGLLRSRCSSTDAVVSTRQ
jgi:glycerophosphoryl diester phosphodiesterase